MLGQVEEALILLLVLYYVFTIISQITLTVRRLHDIGRSGWWHLLTFVPFGGFVLLNFSVMASEPHANVYGPEPFERNIAS